MSAGVPALPLGLDPLIAEAKERARRRRLLALGAAAVIAAAAIGTTLDLRSSAGNSLGICATPPSGWKEQTVTNEALGPPTVVLTNFRFGRMDNFYGLAGLRFPAQGVTVAVSNEGPGGTPPFRHALRVSRGDLWGLEGLKSPAANVAIRSHGRVLNAYVEVGAVTPATIAAANRALAGVQVCSS